MLYAAIVHSMIVPSCFNFRLAGALASLTRRGQASSSEMQSSKLPQIVSENQSMPVPSFLPRVVQRYFESADFKSYSTTLEWPLTSNDSQGAHTEANIEQSIKAFEKVVGIPEWEIKKGIIMHVEKRGIDDWETESFVDRLISWKDVRRGKDLYIKGMGSFSINDIYHQAVVDRVGQNKLQDIACDKRGPYWLPHVSEMQFHAYFSSIQNDYGRSHVISLLSNPKDCPKRQHLIDNYHYWNDPNHIGSIDEIARCEDWPDDTALTKTPRRLLNHLRAVEKMQAMGPEVRFNHLNSLWDTQHMKVLRTNYEIARAADKLRNCARNYVNDVREGRMILILLVNEIGNPVALGSISTDKILRKRFGFVLGANGYSQIYEFANRKPSKETVGHFDHYARDTLETWIDLYAKKGFGRDEIHFYQLANLEDNKRIKVLRTNYDIARAGLQFESFSFSDLVVHIEDAKKIDCIFTLLVHDWGDVVALGCSRTKKVNGKAFILEDYSRIYTHWSGSTTTTKLFHEYALKEKTKWNHCQWDELEKEILGKPEVLFDHLSNLPDEGRIEVLRSNHEIAIAARRLHKKVELYFPFVETYIPDATSGKAIFMMLIDNSDEAVALGIVYTANRNFRNPNNWEYDPYDYDKPQGLSFHWSLPDCEKAESSKAPFVELEDYFKGQVRTWWVERQTNAAHTEYKDTYFRSRVREPPKDRFFEP